MPIKYLNGITMAIVPAQGTSTTINAADRFPVALGELAITTDTQRLYIALPDHFTKAAMWILPDVVCFEGEILVTLDGEIVIRGY